MGRVGVSSVGLPVGGVTPDRRTIVRINMAEEVMVEPPFGFERWAKEVGLGVGSECEHVSFETSGVWGLDSAQYSGSLSEASGCSVLLPSSEGFPAMVADGFQEVALGGGSGPGEIFLKKQVTAGDSWEKSLAEDQAYFRGLVEGGEGSALMDRVLVSEASYKPDQGFLFRFYMPGSKMHVLGQMMTVYFGGPSGRGSDFKGRGEYALSLHGDGKAYLYQRGLLLIENREDWRLHGEFRYSDAHGVCQNVHALMIKPVCTREGKIAFSVCSYAVGESGLTEKRGYIDSSSKQRDYVISIGQVDGQFVQSCLFRVDVRRDVRPYFQASLVRYFEKGRLRDDPFCLPHYPTQKSRLRLEWFGQVPEGCSLSGRLFSPNGPLSVVEEGDGYCEFQLVPYQNAYYAEFEFAGDGQRTPCLSGYRVTRDGVLAMERSEPIVVENVSELNLVGAESDPGHESGSLLINDVGSKLECLNRRGMIPIQIDVESGGVDTRLTTLFRGYIVQANALPLGGTSSVVQYRCQLVGLWSSLARANVPVRLNWGLDPLVSKGGDLAAYKVTDVIRTLIHWGGFSHEMIDIEDLPVRLWSDGGSGDFVLEPMVKIGDAVLRLAKEYLNCSVYFDANAGDLGQWRLCSLDGETGEPVALFMNQLSLSSSQISDRLVSGFVRKKTEKIWAKSPRANYVTVTGLKSAGKFGHPHRLTQSLAHSRSFDFGGHPTANVQHVDYLGRCVPKLIVDASLSCEESVNVAVKRAYRSHCRGSWMIQFEGPLLLVPCGDKRSRSLRFGDRVLVDKTEWVVRNVNARYRKDHMQMAVYECERYGW